MLKNKIWIAAKNEADWLRYYGHVDTRMSEDFNDHLFYSRIKSIGYTKRKVDLVSRCSMAFVTSYKSVLESELDDLIIVSGPVNHSANVYTALEFFVARRLGIDELITIIKK